MLRDFVYGACKVTAVSLLSAEGLGRWDPTTLVWSCCMEVPRALSPACLFTALCPHACFEDTVTPGRDFSQQESGTVWHELCCPQATCPLSAFLLILTCLIF